MRPTVSSISDNCQIGSAPSTSAGLSIRRKYRRGSTSKSGDSIGQRSRMVKASRSWKERKQTMETMGKLKELVPTVDKDECVSRTELLQHVIDYIFQLQRQLNDPLTITEDREL